MSIATNDNYTIASGQAVYAGRYPDSIENLPLWRTQMQVNSWVELPGTSSLSDKKPAHWQELIASGGLSGRINAWTGFAGTDSCLYLAASGGHVDWAGNEVYKLNLLSETPTWEMIHDSSRGSAVIIDSPYYLDGKPSAGHLYYSPFVVGDHVLKVNSGSTYGSGNFGTADCAAFSISGNSWLPAKTFPDCPTASYAIAMCKDTRTEEIYVVSGMVLTKRAVDGSYTTLAAIPENGSAFYYAASAIDTTRNRVVFFADAYHPGVGGYYYTISTNTFTAMSFSGHPSGGVAAAGHQAYYLPSLDRFILRMGGPGGSVWSIHPTTWVWTEITTVGGESITTAANCVFTKFQYMADLKGFFYQPNHASNGFFLSLEN